MNRAKVFLKDRLHMRNCSNDVHLKSQGGWTKTMK